MLQYNAAHIIVGGKLAVYISGVGVNQFLTFENTIDRTSQRAVALGVAGFAVLLGNGGVPFLQPVLKGLPRDHVPLDGCILAVGNDIPPRHVHFLQSVAGADQHIAEISAARAVRGGVLVHGQAAERGTTQMGSNPLYQTVLAGFDDNEIAAF